METVPAASRSGSDRLSNLPDCLLHSVLSSLRSRQVVQTCLLSRRWRHLWRSVPCLDVDQRDFMLVEPEPEAPRPSRGPSDEDCDVSDKARKERLDEKIKRRFTTTGLLEDEPLEFCEFHNLRTLILIECDIGDGCQVLRYVLENVPNLETLGLQYCKVSGRYRGESASSCSSTAIHGCKNLKSIQVKYKDYDVPHVLVVVLTQIAKNVVRHSKRNSVGWLDWMRRVVSCSQVIFLSQQYAADSAVAESDNSQSDEEHESVLWKHRAQKKHERDGAMKARRKAAHPARR